jgi:cyclophilin family peptidyl-prolyl cis-trans isomerase
MKYIFNRVSITVIGIIFTMVSCNNAQNTNTEETAVANEPTPVEQPVTPPATTADSTQNQKSDTVIIKTSMGEITVALYNETPLHKANFLKLVNEKFYEGTLFHRVIKDFMIQGGDPNSKNSDPRDDGQGGPGYQIPAEINGFLKHKRGALAAARTPNPEKASSGSQFYICHVDYPPLDGEYTVYGQTVSGFEVIDKIANTPTAPGDRPLKDVKIISMTLKGAKKTK